MRNGVIADSLRKAGCPRRLIWGVNLPQLSEIAAGLEKSVELAEALWADSSLRESILLAPMVYPLESINIERAREMVDDILWAEEADILCFKLLRNADFAPDLARELCQSDRPLKRYAGLRLWFNIVAKHPSGALEAALGELSRPEPLGLASMLAEEARLFL